MGFGPDVRFSSYRAACYVDKILRGARPADLPVEQPTRLEFAVNRATARDFDLDLPPHVVQPVTEWFA
jgi:ABC-type uncharacterized transport system substrate-binding protein